MARRRGGRHARRGAAGADRRALPRLRGVPRAAERFEGDPRGGGHTGPAYPFAGTVEGDRGTSGRPDVAASRLAAEPVESAWAAACGRRRAGDDAGHRRVVRVRPPWRSAGSDGAASDLARNAASELQLAEQHYQNAITALEQLTVAARQRARPVGRRRNRAEPEVDRSRHRRQPRRVEVRPKFVRRADQPARSAPHEGRAAAGNRIAHERKVLRGTADMMTSIATLMLVRRRAHAARLRAAQHRLGATGPSRTQRTHRTHRTHRTQSHARSHADRSSDAAPTARDAAENFAPIRGDREAWQSWRCSFRCRRCRRCRRATRARSRASETGAAFPKAGSNRPSRSRARFRSARARR